jgi:hypothetical protein
MHGSHVLLLSVLCFCGENTLTEEEADCHSLILKCVREDLNFYNLRISPFKGVRAYEND